MFLFCKAPRLIYWACNSPPRGGLISKMRLRAGTGRKQKPLLVEEVDADPKSNRAARLLVLAGGVFFLDGQYLNAAIAWKKAEAIAPLDDRSRFTLAIKVNWMKRSRTIATPSN